MLRHSIFISGVLLIGFNFNFYTCTSQLLRVSKELQESRAPNTYDVGSRHSNCPTRKPVVYLPRQEDAKEFKTCYEKVAQVRRNPIESRGKRTKEAILEQRFYLKTYVNVTTPDGYILTVFRVTGSEKEPPRKGKPAVMLFHPMTTSSDGWFMLSGNKSLVIKLVNAGYEVWLPNARGTDYSQGHVRLDANRDLAYWDFNMQEIGIYDLPTCIDLALAETGNKKIFYIGYSLSVNTFAIMLAEKPEYNEKVEASFWMGTVMHIGHSTNIVRLSGYLHATGLWFQEFTNILLRGRMGVGAMATPPLLYRFCSSSAAACGLCGNTFFFLFGYDATQIHYADIAHMTSFMMNSFSVKTFVHLGENMETCRFQKFNYGRKKNLKLYGQPYPPLYNLSNVRVPVYMYYGDADNISPPEDQEITRDSLPPGTVKGFFRVKWKQFNHIDFTFARDADKLVYDSILSIIKSYL